MDSKKCQSTSNVSQNIISDENLLYDDYEEGEIISCEEGEISDSNEINEDPIKFMKDWRVKGNSKSYNEEKWCPYSIPCLSKPCGAPKHFRLNSRLINGAFSKGNHCKVQRHKRKKNSSKRRLPPHRNGHVDFLRPAYKKNVPSTKDSKNVHEYVKFDKYLLGKHRRKKTNAVINSLNLDCSVSDITNETESHISANVKKGSLGEMLLKKQLKGQLRSNVLLENFDATKPPVYEKYEIDSCKNASDCDIIVVCEKNKIHSVQVANDCNDKLICENDEIPSKKKTTDSENKKSEKCSLKETSDSEEIICERSEVNNLKEANHCSKVTCEKNVVHNLKETSVCDKMICDIHSLMETNDCNKIISKYNEANDCDDEMILRLQALKSITKHKKINCIIEQQEHSMSADTSDKKINPCSYHFEEMCNYERNSQDATFLDNCKTNTDLIDIKDVAKVDPVDMEMSDTSDALNECNECIETVEDIMNCTFEDIMESMKEVGEEFNMPNVNFHYIKDFPVELACMIPPPVGKQKFNTENIDFLNKSKKFDNCEVIGKSDVGYYKATTVFDDGSIANIDNNKMNLNLEIDIKVPHTEKTNSQCASIMHTLKQTGNNCCAIDPMNVVQISGDEEVSKESNELIVKQVDSFFASLNQDPSFQRAVSKHQESKVPSKSDHKQPKSAVEDEDDLELLRARLLIDMSKKKSDALNTASSSAKVITDSKDLQSNKTLFKFPQIKPVIININSDTDESDREFIITPALPSKKSNCNFYARRIETEKNFSCDKCVPQVCHLSRSQQEEYKHLQRQLALKKSALLKKKALKTTGYLNSTPTRFLLNKYRYTNPKFDYRKSLSYNKSTIFQKRNMVLKNVNSAPKTSTTLENPCNPNVSCETEKYPQDNVNILLCNLPKEDYNSSTQKALDDQHTVENNDSDTKSVISSQDDSETDELSSSDSSSSSGDEDELSLREKLIQSIKNKMSTKKQDSENLNKTVGIRENALDETISSGNYKEVLSGHTEKSSEVFPLPSSQNCMIYKDHSSSDGCGNKLSNSNSSYTNKNESVKIAENIDSLFMKLCPKLNANSNSNTGFIYKNKLNKSESSAFGCEPIYRKCGDKNISFNGHHSLILKQLEKEFAARRNDIVKLENELKKLIRESTIEARKRQLVRKNVTILRTKLKKAEDNFKERTSGLKAKVARVRALQSKIMRDKKKIYELETQGKLLRKKVFGNEYVPSRKFELLNISPCKQLSNSSVEVDNSSVCDMLNKTEKLNERMFEDKKKMCINYKKKTVLKPASSKFRISPLPSTSENDRKSDGDFGIVCPFDLLGRCNDDTCTYHHFKRFVEKVPIVCNSSEAVMLPEMCLQTNESIIYSASKSKEQNEENVEKIMSYEVVNLQEFIGSSLPSTCVNNLKADNSKSTNMNKSLESCSGICVTDEMLSNNSNTHDKSACCSSQFTCALIEIDKNLDSVEGSVLDVDTSIMNTKIVSDDLQSKSSDIKLCKVHAGEPNDEQGGTAQKSCENLSEMKDVNVLDLKIKNKIVGKNIVSEKLYKDDLLETVVKLERTNKNLSCGRNLRSRSQINCEQETSKSCGRILRSTSQLNRSGRIGKVFTYCRKMERICTHKKRKTKRR